MPGEISLRWSAYEHDHIERGAEWYWALGIIALSIAITSLLFQDFFFAILIVIAAITLALLARTQPDISEFELSDAGIRIDDALHRFDEILAFWVETEASGRPMLFIDTTKFLSPNLIIPIEHIDPALVRAFLVERVEERRMKESLSHKVLEFFGL